MRIRQVAIDGYGRFTGLALNFEPGLQVIIGPNEQGKSTFRSFIGDMLYGQKRSTAQRAYEESNELRVPWNNPDCYGGALRYVLDQGNEIEVIRNFDRKRETIQVYDRTHAREITGEFELLRNREVDYAATHLGLSKDIFLSTATITHFTLDGLGDRDALHQIREKLLALTDSGDESGSADGALRVLKLRITEIGSSGARTKPLPLSRARLSELESEHTQALELQAEMLKSAEQRHQLLAEINELREKRRGTEAALRLFADYEDFERLQEAEQLLERINEATQRCFALGSVRDFPLERMAEVQTAENAAANARAQLHRSQDEAKRLAEQLRAERRNLPPDAADRLESLPEDLEQRFNELSTTVHNLEQRREEAESLVKAAKPRLAEAQKAVSSLPDFGKVAPDPVEWITQLASSFSIAKRSRDDECALREKLRTEIKQRRAGLSHGEELFRECQDFPEQAREFELEKRVKSEQVAQRENTLQVMQAAREDVEEEMPGLRWLSILCALFLSALVTAFFLTSKLEILYAAGLIALAIGYFVSRIFVARRRLRRIASQIEEARGELGKIQARENAAPGLIETLMQRAGSQTVRELEAMFDQYRSGKAELDARLEVFHTQVEKASEAEQRVEKLVARFQKTFEDIGETIHGENDVQEAAGRCIARYQEYREAKRRISDSRAVLERHEVELKRIGQLIEHRRKELGETEVELQKILGKALVGSSAEATGTSAALRAYRSQIVGLREQYARLKLLEEKAHNADTQAKADAADLGKLEQQLSRMLAQSGSASVAQWKERAKQAQEYRDLWSKRGGLEEQLNSVLRGGDIGQLRARAAAAGPLPPKPASSPTALKTELEILTQAIDDRNKEEHALHVQLAQRGAGRRALSEIEEEQATVEAQSEALHVEFEAASYAMALIEEIARDKHARMAPKLAAAASGYMEEITGGAYSELLLSREMNISVRIPQTKRMSENPEKTLSKGTVDQVYLALRLALVRSLSESGESVPMLLDDPFANYDDARLAHTMKLLEKIAGDNQILLFTCREDVVRAAEAIGAPVIQL